MERYRIHYTIEPDITIHIMEVCATSKLSAKNKVRQHEHPRKLCFHRIEIADASGRFTTIETIH